MRLISGEEYLWLGFGLLALEAIFPMGFTLALGLGAVITGGISLFYLHFAQYQLLGFVAASLVMLFLTREYVMANFIFVKPNITTLNAPLEGFEGKIFALHSPILHGEGKIMAGDSLWLVQGQDQSEGRVKVIGVKNSVLQVEMVT